MRRRMSSVRARGRELGTTTAEYAVVIMVAVGFAGALLKIMRSGFVASMLTGIVKRALSIA